MTIAQDVGGISFAPLKKISRVGCDIMAVTKKGQNHYFRFDVGMFQLTVGYFFLSLIRFHLFSLVASFDMIAFSGRG